MLHPAGRSDEQSGTKNSVSQHRILYRLRFNCGAEACSSLQFFRALTIFFDHPPMGSTLSSFLRLTRNAIKHLSILRPCSLCPSCFLRPTLFSLTEMQKVPCTVLSWFFPTGQIPQSSTQLYQDFDHRHDRTRDCSRTVFFDQLPKTKCRGRTLRPPTTNTIKQATASFF